MKIYNNPFIQSIKKLPIVRNIPGFNTVPDSINPNLLRFYKLCNLVHTLGMFTHASWVMLFLFLNLTSLALINIVSVFVYIFNIYINRKGFHMTSVVVMVAEIILHQIIAVRYVGWDAGFQYYIIVIALFPFLMPKGRWAMKTAMLVACSIAYLTLDYLFKKQLSLYAISQNFIHFFNISNTVFAFTFMDLSGAYFNFAMDETEEKLKQKTNELVEAEKISTLGKVATEMAHEIQNPLNFVNNFADINQELIAELKAELLHNPNEDIINLINDIEQNSIKISNNGKRVSTIVSQLQKQVNDFELRKNNS